MQQVGIIGMAVMGKNLALNIKNSGYSVSVFNITRAETDEVASKYADKNLLATYSWEEFVGSLEKPRKIIMMIKAGSPVDQTIEHLQGILDKGDILIDGGNSFYKDTNRRYQYLQQFGINYIGMGISGGELGALNGPSMMPGGDEEICQKLLPLFKKIAAKTPANEACVNYIGPEGSGHYVKMVHNGIEYGIMQAICEIYDILRNILNLNNAEISDIFDKWNQGSLNSYLISITTNILRQKDPITQKDMVDVILNKADYKGTGNWMIEDALRLGTPISVIFAAVFARFVSNSTLGSLENPTHSDFTIKNKNKFIKQLESSLYLAQIISYAQGFEQLRCASKAYNWNLNYANIAQIWEAGCIVRAASLTNIKNSFEKHPNIKNIFQAPFFEHLAKENLSSLRDVIKSAHECYIPTPVLDAALDYILSIFNSKLPANLLQAQRDYFGAHTYARIDRSGTFHTQWYDEK